MFWRVRSLWSEGTVPSDQREPPLWSEGTVASDQRVKIHPRTQYQGSLLLNKRCLCYWVNSCIFTECDFVLTPLVTCLKTIVGKIVDTDPPHQIFIQKLIEKSSKMSKFSGPENWHFRPKNFWSVIWTKIWKFFTKIYGSILLGQTDAILTKLAGG